MATTTWMIQEAKNKFCQLIDQVSESPQIITKRGEAVAVIISYKEYVSKQGANESLYDFLTHSPLVGSELPIEERRVDTDDRGLSL